MDLETLQRAVERIAKKLEEKTEECAHYRRVQEKRDRWRRLTLDFALDSDRPPSKLYQLLLSWEAYDKEDIAFEERYAVATDPGLTTAATSTPMPHDEQQQQR